MEEQRWSLNQIIEEIREEDGIETKTLPETARSIMGCMGLFPSTLKDENNRYQFGEKGHDFWKKALANYSKDPYTRIRSKDYEKVPLDVIHEFMDMVVETMSILRKPSREIQTAILHIDDTVGYSAHLSKKHLLSKVEQSSLKYIDIIDKQGFLLHSDRLSILDYVENHLLPHYLDEMLEKAGELAEYFNDTRLSEVQDAALSIDSTSTEKMIAADDAIIESEKDDLLEGPGNTITLSKKADISAFIAAQNKLNEEKKKQRSAIDRELDISPDERRKYDSIRYRPSKEILREALEEINMKSQELQENQMRQKNQILQEIQKELRKRRKLQKRRQLQKRRKFQKCKKCKKTKKSKRAKTN
nr:hypothetical protein [uncultured Oscillibacter sp.]